MRREPIETRKALLAKLLKGSHGSIVLNEHYEEDGATVVFREACRLGCEGIVSKRLGSMYRRTRPYVTKSRRTTGLRTPVLSGHWVQQIHLRHYRSRLLA